MPLGLYYLSSSLMAEGYKVLVIDLTNTHTLNDLIRHLLINEVIVAGVTCCTPNFYEAVKIVQVIKRYSPSTKTILGGPHATAQYEQILKMHLEIDYVCIGPGEKSIVNLLKFIEGTIAFSSVNNIARRDTKNITINLDDCPNLDPPFPARDFFYRNMGTVMASVAASRGCPHFCSFCFSKYDRMEKWMCRDLELVGQEIKQLVDSNNVNTILFTDSNFLASRNRAYDLLALIQPLNIKFCIASRADSLLKFSENLDFMFDCGCTYIELGIESGSQEQLDRYNKGIHVKDNVDAILLLKKHRANRDFKYNFSFIFFDYDMSFSDLILNIEFFIKNSIDTIENEHALFSSLVYLPGSQLYENALSKGLIVESYDIPFSYFADHRVGTVYAFVSAYENLILPNIKVARKQSADLYSKNKNQKNAKQLAIMKRISYKYAAEIIGTGGDRISCQNVFLKYFDMAIRFLDSNAKELVNQ